MSARGVLRVIEGDKLAWWCPGCQCAHAVPVARPGRPGWTFNGDYDLPTFAPSVDSPYARTGYTVAKTRAGRCHSFVRDGQIQFLGDCTHELRGKTVPLEPFP